jgi:hypothetical protein
MKQLPLRTLKLLHTVSVLASRQERFLVEERPHQLSCTCMFFVAVCSDDRVRWYTSEYVLYVLTSDYRYISYQH